MNYFLLLRPTVRVFHEVRSVLGGQGCSALALLLALTCGLTPISAIGQNSPPKQASTAKELLVVGTGIRYASTVAFSPDGTKIVVGGDRTHEIRDTSAPRKIIKLSPGGHPYFVDSISFSPDGKRIASGHADKNAYVWDAQSGELLLSLEGHKGRVFQVLFSPDGKVIASGSVYTVGQFKEARWQRMVIVWEAETGRELLRFTGDESLRTVGAFSPDGKRVVSQGGLFSPDGKQIIAMQRNSKGSTLARTLQVWDLETGRFTLELNYAKTATDAPINGKSIIIWDAKTGTEMRRLQWESTGQVSSLAFDPQGTKILSIESNSNSTAGNWMDSIIRTWDPISGEQIEKISIDGLDKHGLSGFDTSHGLCHGPIFSPNNKRIAIITSPIFQRGTSVRIWDIERLWSAESATSP